MVSNKTLMTIDQYFPLNSVLGSVVNQRSTDAFRTFFCIQYTASDSGEEESNPYNWNIFIDEKSWSMLTALCTAWIQSSVCIFELIYLIYSASQAHSSFSR